MRPFLRPAAVLRRLAVTPHPAGRVGVGTDLVLVATVAASLARFGDRYLRRVYTAAEIDYCLGQAGGAAPHLAARFAAKEATIKALRPSVEIVGWRSVEVMRGQAGSCHLVLHGSARALAERRGIRQLAVSLSHEGEYASAVVVAQGWSSPYRSGLFHRRTPRGAYER